MKQLAVVLTRLILLVCFVLSDRAVAEDLGFERERAKIMLDVAARHVEKNFYDANLRGLEWKTLKEQARQRIETANSVNDMLTAIFTLLNKLHDSHTLFLPPERMNKALFGFEAKVFGERVMIYKVKKESAAAAAGLQPGDELLSVNGFKADRASFDLMMLYFRALRPVTALDLVYARGDEPAKSVRLEAKMKEGRVQRDLTQGFEIWELIREAESHRESYRYLVHKEGIGYLHLPSFTANRDFLIGLAKEVDESKAMIVDLRGNHGGAVEIMSLFMGLFESMPTVVGELHFRQKKELLEIKPQKPQLPGPMFILVDSQSASAAEVFARHFQSRGRAVVIGDQTSGRVTLARFYPEQVGYQVIVPYGVEVAVARLVFPDGQELEGRGVKPDHVCLPTGKQLREERDPCRGLALHLARKALGHPEETAPSESSESPKDSEKNE